MKFLSTSIVFLESDIVHPCGAVKQMHEVGVGTMFTLQWTTESETDCQAE